MILIDTNLLIYAVNRDSPAHKVARDWLEHVFSSDTVVGIPWLVLLAFIRLTTNPRVMQFPMHVDRALEFVDDWLAQPYVTPLNPGERHWSILRLLLSDNGSAGNLTNDAHIAAIALEYNYAVYSSDNDFKRFKGLTHVNPLDARQVQEAPKQYRVK